MVIQGEVAFNVVTYIVTIYAIPASSLLSIAYAMFML